MGTYRHRKQEDVKQEMLEAHHPVTTVVSLSHTYSTTAFSHETNFPKDGQACEQRIGKFIGGVCQVASGELHLSSPSSFRHPLHSHLHSQWTQKTTGSPLPPRLKVPPPILSSRKNTTGSSPATPTCAPSPPPPPTHPILT